MEYFNKILHTYTCQHYISTAMHNSVFGERGFAEHQFKIWNQLMEMLITFEPRSIFTSNFVYLCTLTLSIHCRANDDEASPSII